MNFRKSREIIGTPKNVTISRLRSYWFVSIQVEMEVPEPSHPSQSMVGIDMGVKRLFTLSTCNFEEPIESRKWREKINRLHAKLSNIRRDLLHKFSSALSKSHAVIVLENLQIRSMAKSAKDNRENPGRRVAQKSCLNRAILDQGWGMFKIFLEYKQRWLGGRVIYVNPKHTSQICPVCYTVSKDNRQTQSAFACVRYGHLEHADMVGSKNILERGRRLLACGENWVAKLSEAGTGRLSDKPEPILV